MKNYIDGDILVYRIGFGFQNYDLLENTEGMDFIINNIVSKFPDHEPCLVVSNTDKTFRHDLAVTQPYKGNRTAPKPKFYKELRQYLIEEREAVVSPSGYEADDTIGMSVDKKTDIISTIDKDLYMIPAAGHYNFVKDELVKIKRPSYYFWKQMLIGDRADNIRGLHLIGEKRATELLDGLKVKEMRRVVEEQYAREFDDKWQDRFTENGRLLWIKRHPDKEFWDYL